MRAKTTRHVVSAHPPHLVCQALVSHILFFVTEPGLPQVGNRAHTQDTHEPQHPHRLALTSETDTLGRRRWLSVS